MASEEDMRREEFRVHLDDKMREIEEMLRSRELHRPNAKLL